MMDDVVGFYLTSFVPITDIQHREREEKGLTGETFNYQIPEVESSSTTTPFPIVYPHLLIYFDEDDNNSPVVENKEEVEERGNFIF